MAQYNIDSMAAHEIVKAQQTFLSKVYAWMVGGLLLTGLTAWYIFNSQAFMIIAGNSILFFGIIIGELILVSVLSARIDRMSKNTAAGLFLLYSVLNGVTFSVLFAAYTLQSIQNVFFISAAMFGAMSAFGFLTKRDLSGVGRFLFMGLIGVIAVMFINFFVQSSAFDFAASILGVVIFAGLTAWDTQKLKGMFQVQYESEDVAVKGTIIGALMLYLDFINIFLFLLRLFGNRR